MTVINPNLLSTIIAASITAFLGLVVLLHNKNSVSSKIFIFHSLIGTAWAITNYFSLTVPPETALLLIRFVIFWAVFYVFLFFIFVENFPDENFSLKKNKIVFLAILIIFMAILALSKYIFEGVEVISGEAIPIPGKIVKLFGGILTGFLLLSTIRVIKNYISIKNNKLLKKQWLSIGMGLLLAYSLLIFFVFFRVILFGDTTYVPYSPLFTLPIFMGAAYAILKLHLFNMKVIRAEILTFLLLLTNILGVIISNTLLDRIVSLIGTTLILIFGILLIKSVIKEVEQREKLQVLTTELAIKNEALDQANRQKTLFLSIANHDMKSPIAKIKQWAAGILDKTYKEPAAIDEKLHKMVDAADDSITMVDQFLNINKIEEGKMEYTFENQNIVEFVRKIVDDTKPVAAKKGLALTCTDGANAILVNIDIFTMKQVIENLLSNAIKYTEKGSVNVTIKEEQKSVLITVKDTGLGIDPNLIPTLFVQYHRDPSVAKKIQGTGLGLYIARLFVLANRGEIWVESQGQGTGSAFFVRLPKANA